MHKLATYEQRHKYVHLEQYGVDDALYLHVIDLRDITNMHAMLFFQSRNKAWRMFYKAVNQFPD